MSVVYRHASEHCHLQRGRVSMQAAQFCRERVSNQVIVHGGQRVLLLLAVPEARSPLLDPEGDGDAEDEDQHIEREARSVAPQRVPELVKATSGGVSVWQSATM